MKTHAISVKKIHGTLCRTTPDLFREFSSALQFPYYFGYNWHAFNDCLFDMEWDHADHYMIIVFDANNLLVESPLERHHFFTILDAINQEWVEPNKYFPRNRKPTAFHVILHAETTYIPLLLQYLCATKSPFTIMK